MIVAWLLSHQCTTDTAWFEGYAGSFRAVCGDEDGNAISYPRLVPDAGIVVFVAATPPITHK